MKPHKNDLFFWRVLSSLLLFFVLSSQDAQARRLQDSTGRWVELPPTLRIVSLNGTITETVYALGLGHTLVGRDTSSYYPSEAERLPSVGYQYRLNAEGILRLRPTLVLGRSDLRPRTVLAQLASTGVAVFLLKPPINQSESEAMIRLLGKALNREAAASRLLQATTTQLQKLRQAQKKTRDLAKMRVLFLYIRGHRVRFVLGRKTSIDGMLSLVGATNAASFSGTRQLSAEALIGLRPDVILLFKKSFDSIGGAKGLKALQGIAQTPAGKAGRFVVMDDLYLGGFGPRTGAAARDLFSGIYRAKGTWFAP